MSFRHWLNIATLVIIILILFFSRHELVAAWKILGDVHLGVLALIVPAQFLSYFAAGAMMFSYLRAKGDLSKVRSIEVARMALELNFVNHVLPTGGVSGASYMTWRLNKLGVTSGRATLAQVVRFGATFIAFLALLLIAVLLITIDGSINRLTILVSCALASLIIFGTFIVMYVVGSRSRLATFSGFLYRAINRVWRFVTRRSRPLVEHEMIHTFFEDLHQDYVSLRKDPKILRTPFLWGIVYNIAEVSMFVIAFLSLGQFVNPAPILIAVGIAGLAGLLMVTPGGTGAYETLMILFLTSAGVNPGIAVAGVLLARVILVLLTICTGYVFYHQALKKYGSDSHQR